MMRALTLCLALVVPAAAAAQDSPIPLTGAEVVVLGETHDNPAQHANQARVVAALQPRALVFEMLRPDQTTRITPGNRLDEAALNAALHWDASGWPDFAMYFPIFAAAPEARIYGAQVGRSDAARVIEEGLAGAFGPDLGRYGLDRPLPSEEQAAREADQAEAHCNELPDEMMAAMVDMQRLRDAVLARTALQALEETGGPVAVITGNGHARNDRGLPVYFRQAAPGRTLMTLGQFEAPPKADTPPPYDFWLVTEPVERDDPCAVFR